MKNRSWIYLLLCAICFTGCVSTVRTTAHYPLGQFPPTQPALVNIMFQAPQRPSVVIGEASVGSIHPNGSMAPYDEKKLREEVASIGGDAVLLNIATECVDVMTPERTVITTKDEVTGKKHKTKEEVQEITHYPATVTKSCSSKAVGKILKFKDQG